MKINPDDFPKDLGNGVEIHAMTKDGRFIVRYKLDNGQYNLIAYSPKPIPGVEYYKPSDARGQAANRVIEDWCKKNVIE